MTEFSFRIATHIDASKQVVEIWEGNVFKAGLYPTERGVRIVSKHGLETTHDPTYPNAVNINIGEPRTKEPSGNEGESR